ncbi:hypothetical protein AN1V17_03740 [Vallitalea sediminicola]
MESVDYNLLKNIMPELKYSVRRVCTPSWSFRGPFYRHNFILIYEGRAHFERNNKEVYEGSKGDLIYFPPNSDRYAYTYKDDLMKCYAIVFQYTCPEFNDETNEWELKSTPLPFELGQKINDEYFFSAIKKTMSELNSLWLSNKSFKELKMKAHFMELMNYLISWKTQEGINYYNIKKVDTIIDYMCKHYNEKITLEELASMVNISISYLGNIFKEVTQKSPIDYLMNIRLTRAKQLIDDGYKISECAKKTGFSDIYYFSKYFKKHEGMTPTMYAKRI